MASKAIAINVEAAQTFLNANAVSAMNRLHAMSPCPVLSFAAIAQLVLSRRRTEPARFGARTLTNASAIPASAVLTAGALTRNPAGSALHALLATPMSMASVRIQMNAMPSLAVPTRKARILMDLSDVGA